MSGIFRISSLQSGGRSGCFGFGLGFWLRCGYVRKILKFQRCETREEQERMWSSLGLSTLYLNSQKNWLKISKNFLLDRFLCNIPSSGLKLKWLQFELNRWYGKKNIATRLLMMVHLRLASVLPPSWISVILRDIQKTCSDEYSSKRKKKMQKIEYLRVGILRKKNQLRRISTPFFPRSINQTYCVTFDEKNRPTSGEKP